MDLLEDRGLPSVSSGVRKSLARDETVVRTAPAAIPTANRMTPARAPSHDRWRRRLARAGDVSSSSWVKISQIRALSIERLGRRIGALSADEVDRIVDGLFELVG